MAMNKYANLELSRGDIVWVRSRVTRAGSEQDGTRPAVIVSNDMANLYSPVVIAVPLTNRRKKGLPTHATVTIAENKSTALCEQVSAISVDRIINIIDHVKKKELSDIDNALKVALSLAKET